MMRRLRVWRSKQSALALSLCLFISLLLVAILGNSARLAYSSAKLVIAMLCVAVALYCLHALFGMGKQYARMRTAVIGEVAQILVICTARPAKTRTYYGDSEYVVSLGRKNKYPHIVVLEIQEEVRAQNIETGYDDSVVYKRVYEFHETLRTVTHRMDVTYRRVTAGNLQRVRMTVADQPEIEQDEWGNTLRRDVELERLNAVYDTVSPRDLEQLRQLLAAPAV